MNPPAEPSTWRVVVRNLLGSLGLLGSAAAAGAAAIPPATQPIAPVERVLLEQRVTAVRNFYAREEPPADGSTQTVAQWWPNWPNWSNWRNWFNGR